MNLVNVFKAAFPNLWVTTQKWVARTFQVGRQDKYKKFKKISFKTNINNLTYKITVVHCMCMCVCELFMGGHTTITSSPKLGT